MATKKVSRKDGEVSDGGDGGDGGFEPPPTSFDNTPPEGDVTEPPFENTPIGGGDIPLVPVNPINDNTFIPIEQFGGPDSAFGKILKQLGLIGANGAVNVAGLMGALGPILGGVLGTRANNTAAGQLQQANTQAMDFLKGQMGTQQANFKPYIDAGTGAMGKLQAMPASNLAANFSPLGTGYGLGLSANNQMPRGSTFAEIMAARNKPAGG